MLRVRTHKRYPAQLMKERGSGRYDLELDVVVGWTRFMLKHRRVRVRRKQGRVAALTVLRKRKKQYFSAQRQKHKLGGWE